MSQSHKHADVESTLVKPKLCQIDITKFGRQLDQFNPFRSLHDNLMHISSMAPIEKFSYLKSLLVDPTYRNINTFTYVNEY